MRNGMVFHRVLWAAMTAAIYGFVVTASVADDKAAADSKPIPLNKKGTVLLDKANKRLLLKSKVVLREGLLEMFCCPSRTKEHESIVSLDAKAYVVHAGLLALGAKTGTPVKFTPKYVAPTGQELEIFVRWKDKAGKEHRSDARKWMRYAVRRYFAVPMKSLPDGFKLPERKELDLRFDDKVGELLWYGHMTDKQRDQLLKLSTDKPYRKAISELHRRSRIREMDAKWVFVGSQFVVDADMKSRYLAETGSLICVANFATATIDITMNSSATAGNEAFEPFTERIPPLDTEVTVEIQIALPKKKSQK